MPEEVKPKLDDFTAKVVADPAKPQDTLLLQGFLGASSQPDHTRVYSDMTLTSYVDVANADIIHIEPLPKDSSPLGGSYLWVKKEAEVVPAAPVGAASAKAKFLQGPITAEATGVAQQIYRPITIPIVACHPTILVPACYVTRIPIHCPTGPVVCDTVASGFGPCTIPDTTIYQQQGPAPQQFQAAIQQPVAAPAPALPASVQPAACVTGIAQACRSVDVICPTQVCPTPRHVCPSVNQYQCPSVAGYDCPSVNQYHCPSVNQYQCPSVAGYDCPSVNQYHCPSVNNYECPHTLSGLACRSTNPQCPRTLFEDCQTNARILC